MTQQEYEQKKRECWEEFCKDNGLHADGKMFAATDKDFIQLIDRAYALAGQKEPISHEEIEKAAKEYAETAYYPAPDYNWYESDDEQMRECLSDTFKAGANFALGKQEKDGIDLKKLDKMLDDALEKETKESLNQWLSEKDTDTVIQGWVARDEVAIRPALYTSKPLRQKKGFKNGYWSYGMQIGLSLDPSLFPDITWESDPEPVEITIKRKNHE